MGWGPEDRPTDEASAQVLAGEHPWHEETNFPSEMLGGDEARERLIRSRATLTIVNARGIA
ncbi:MAG: hypothetical protein M3R38_07605 [Actinomycetota bacterium]|nr:hypothetical protein [Actinomycetota bacterium]